MGRSPSYGPRVTPRKPGEPDPMVLLRESLIGARRRGIDFDHAWPEAFAAALAAEPGIKNRQALNDTLRAHRDFWQRAYTRTGRPPAPHIAALRTAL